MEKKHVALGGLALVAVVCALAYPSAQWFLFGFKAQDTVTKLGRFPTVEQIVGVKQALGEDARKYKLDVSKLEVKLGLQERSMGPVVFTYLLVDCRLGDKTWSYGGGGQQGLHIETPLSNDYARLEEAGVVIKKP